MKKWIALTAISATLALSVAVLAAPRGNRGDGPKKGQEGPHPMMRILENPEAAEKLGLTDEQVTSLQDLKYETQKAHIALKGEVELAQVEVQRILKSDSPDEAAALAAVEQAGLARIKLQQSHVSTMLKARAIIGPEKLKEIKAEGRERMKERAGKVRERMERFRDGGPRGERPDRPRGPRPGPQDGPPEE